MGKFTKEMVDDYANKLLISLTDEENKMVLEEFDYIPNISEVEPMTHALDDFDVVLSDDVSKPSVPIEDLLRNADDIDGREIEVVKVVG